MQRSTFRVLGVIVLAMVLSGCWLQLGYGSGNTRFNDVESELTDANVASLTEQWRAPIDAFVTEPIVSDGVVYTTVRSDGDDGTTLDVLGVQARDRDSGELTWEQSLIPLEGPDVTGDVATPVMIDGALWVPYWHEGLGDCRGEIARLDPATGEVISNDLTGPHPSNLVTTGSTVAYMNGTCGGTGGSVLVVRDVETRAVLWSHQFAQAGVSTPTIADGRLFVIQRGTLYAFDADGCGALTCAPLWTQPAGTGFFGSMRPTASPDGSALITVADSPLRIVVRDTATGAIRWESDPRYSGSLPGAFTGVALTSDTVYVSGAQLGEDGSGNEAILDAYPLGGCGQPVCSPAWTADLGPTRPSREPTVAAGVVYVPLVGTDTIAPAIVAVDADGCGSPSCDPLTRVPLIHASPPFISNTQSYVTSVADGGVFVGLLPGLHGQTDTELIAFGPSGS